MKITNITLSLALAGALTLGVAANANVATTSPSVDAQITAIQAAPEKERGALMKKFKENVAKMNEHDREAAISKMKMQTEKQTQVHAKQ